MKARWLPNSKTLTIFDPDAREQVFSQFDPKPYGTDSVYYNLDAKLKTQKRELPSRVTSVSCAQCDSVLLKGDWKLSQGPSAYWMDLVDAWSCHKQEFAPMAHRYLNRTVAENEIIVKGETVEVFGLPSQCPHCEALLDARHLICLDGQGWSKAEVLREMLMDLVESRHAFEVQLTNDADCWLLKILNWDCWLMHDSHFERGLCVKASRIAEPCASLETISVSPSLFALIQTEGLVYI